MLWYWFFSQRCSPFHLTNVVSFPTYPVCPNPLPREKLIIPLSTYHWLRKDHRFHLSSVSTRWIRFWCWWDGVQYDSVVTYKSVILAKIGGDLFYNVSGLTSVLQRPTYGTLLHLMYISYFRSVLGDAVPLSCRKRGNGVPSILARPTALLFFFHLGLVNITVLGKIIH